MRTLIVTATLGALLLTGCAANMDAYKRTDRQLPAGSRIGVIPFENLSSGDNAAEKITNLFQTRLNTVERLEIIEYGELFDGLRKYRIRSASAMTSEQIDSLCARLNLDYLIAGAVLEYEERDDRFLGVVPIVSFNCRLIECARQKTVWVATNNGRGDKGELVFGIGAVRSAEELSRRMVNATVGEIESLFEKR